MIGSCLFAGIPVDQVNLGAPAFRQTQPAGQPAGQSPGQPAAVAAGSAAPAPPPSGGSSSSGIPIGTIVGIVVGVIVALVIAGASSFARPQQAMDCALYPPPDFLCKSSIESVTPHHWLRCGPHAVKDPFQPDFSTSQSQM